MKSKRYQDMTFQTRDDIPFMLRYRSMSGPFTLRYLRANGRLTHLSRLFAHKP